MTAAAALEIICLHSRAGTDESDACQFGPLSWRHAGRRVAVPLEADRLSEQSIAMHRLTLSTVAVALVLEVPTVAAEGASENDRFQLWNNCRPVGLVVERLSDQAKAIGLSKSRVATAVRSRLRAARMYAQDRAMTRVYIDVQIHKRAMGITLEYWKTLKDGVSGAWGYAPTWQTGGIGTHGQNASAIISQVAEDTDKFIDEYLRVNADACGKSN